MSDTRTVTIKQARRSINKAFAVKRPIFLWGAPGIGKSDVVAQVTNDMRGFMSDCSWTSLTQQHLRYRQRPIS